MTHCVAEPIAAFLRGYWIDDDESIQASCCFATILSLALRGLGRHTMRGGSLLVAAISGGMVFPPMMAIVGFQVSSTNVVHSADKQECSHCHGIRMIGFVLALAFPVYVNVSNKDAMDSHRNTELNVIISVGKDVVLEERAQSKSTTATIETVEETRPNAR
ncbi:hypothetical protein N7519_011265 [Penicillium mononematosum]|uniref:uncharacterized protein n=1 Tax=Penicillium mononematosum TaxID=268346 RepID=UPI002548BC7F|nr:uncharacterized protein N7519_011265 [Penicillium mononematosum]KAJ6180804.1 hypothetical protein N7519_011265 [Penicillium mononematosum]